MIKKTNWAFVILLSLINIAPCFGQQFRALLFTSPDRWHDRTIPTAIDEFRDLAEKHDFELVWAQSSGSGNTKNVFTDEYLSNIDVIIFLHSRGHDLTKEQMNSFQKFIRNGGGFVGIHATSSIKDRPLADQEQDQWFRQLVGRVITDHPEEQTAVMQVTDKTHPATMHLADQWIWTDEWYSYGDPLTENQTILLTVDEKTYDPDRTWGDNTRFTAMGDFHPIAWYQEFDGGRSFYTTLGHIPASYKDPWFLAHIYGGIYWAATGLGVKK